MGPTPELTAANVSLKESSVSTETYSRSEIGKMRRRYFTKEFGKVRVCGHKFHPTDEPHTSCASCWEAYFMLQEGVRKGVEAIIRSFDIKQLIKARGNKFAKMYQRFVATHPQPIRGDVVAA